MSKREKVLLWILGVVIVLGAGDFVYTKYLQKNNTASTTPTVSNSTPSTTQNQNSTNTTNKTSVITPIVDAGVTWLSTPETLTDLQLFAPASDTFDCDPTSAKYYKIATLDNDGQLIMARMSCGMGGGYTFRFKKSSDGKYALLMKYTNYTINNGANLNSIFKDYSTKTTVDSSTTYAQISSPDAVADAKNITYKKGIYAPFMGNLTVLFSDLKDPKEISQTAYGKIYSVYQADSKSEEAKIRYLYLKHADGTADAYGVPIAFMSDDSIPNVTINSVANKQKFFSSIVVGSCGGLGAVSVVTNTSDISSRIEAIGTTKDGDKIYKLTNSGDPLIQLAYSSYKGDKTNNILTLEQFAAKTPVFLWKDALGDYITFFSQEYAPSAECGKPVVYLYPTKPTNVSVKVDVDMTVSDPAYNKGWNVLADPSGKLTLNGKDYPYLYWEGKGKIYSRPDKGFVVETSKVKEKITEDLSNLGLNKKEIKDFQDFWLPKMPKTPYVRLSWLGTEEMDNLAPMSISPKPDTTIRVFLDFEGLNKKIDIQPQVLKAKERKGFTVIEWGGLLVINK